MDFVKDPTFLQIFFHRPLNEEELFDLYATLNDYKIIEMTREEIDDNIAEDLAKEQPLGIWEFKCEFQDAINCGLRLASDITFFEKGFTFMINDEPTDTMREWLLSKDIKKHYADLIGDFDTSIYHDDKIKSVIFEKGKELSFLSNLITDMTTRGATKEEIADIVKYSMVVIDAEKKKLDWKRAADDFNVKKLADKYGSKK